MKLPIFDHCCSVKLIYVSSQYKFEDNTLETVTSHRPEQTMEGKMKEAQDREVVWLRMTFRNSRLLPSNTSNL